MNTFTAPFAFAAIMGHSGSMARVRSIKTGAQDVSIHPSEVDCTVQAVITTEGATLMQLSSFGSDTRQSQPKVSQTLQFDANMAHIIRDYIDDLFPRDPAPGADQVGAKPTRPSI